MPTCTISLGEPTGDHGTCDGTLEAPTAGTLVLTVTSPRPLRLLLDGRLVLDEDLWYRRYERLLRALVVVPIDAGPHRLHAVYAERPQWPRFVEEHCPSRNRERVRTGLRERLPDRFELAGEVQPGTAAVACSLRVLTGQCVRGGITWQQVLARLLDTPRPGALQTAGPDRPGWQPRPALALRGAVAPHHAIDESDADDRAAGLVRLLVPVAGPANPLPAARDEDADETRLEPSCAIVDELAITLEPALATPRPPGPSAPLVVAAAPVRATLPVHEARGRLSPAREYRELTWPDATTLLARVPRPLLPGAAAAWLPAHDHAWRMLLALRCSVDRRSGLPNDYIGTARDNFANEMFVWDSSFTAMCTAWGWRALPHTATLDCLYSRQMDGGYLHREHDTREGIPIGFEPDFSPNPPITAVAEWKMACLTGDTGRLAAVLPALAAQHGWLRRNRRLPDGTYWTTGLANGLDNSPSLGDGYPDLTAQQAHAAELLGLMAAALGRDDEARAWAAERAEIGAAMNATLWSESMRFFSTSLPGGGHNPNKAVTGFWPLWTGLVPPERVEDLARHLLDPASFWRHHPVPSLAADSPHYQADGEYWLGSTWAPTNAATAWGFARAGRLDLARRLVARHLDVLSEVHRADGVLWENFAPDASARGSWSGPDYSWTALGPIALLYEVALGVQPDALHDRLRWSPPTSAGWGLERIPLGGATIDLRTLGHARFAVATDRPFTLALDHDGIERSARIPAGTWELSAADLRG